MQANVAPMQTTSRDAIAANVRAAVARRLDITHGDLAEHLRLSRSAMSDRLRGVTNFRPEELQALAAFIDQPIDKLLAPAEDVA